MARATSTTPPASSSPKVEDDAAAKARRERRRNRRESVESFVVVVVGFLLWSMEAEGYVIPTGSMAPTLMGRHKEVECPECGWTFRVNADCEVDSSGAGGATGLRVESGVCENCRFRARVDDQPSLAGDRIYTLKTDVSVPFATGLGREEPRRWDVTVFKLPEDPGVRYIKRLIGMPGDLLRLHRGNVWRSDLHGAPFEILRRPPRQSLQVNVPVYDDSYRSRRLSADPRWRRWDGWEEASPGSYRAEASDGWRELRYRHLVPSPEQAEAIAAGRESTPPRPSLVTDFSSFNTDLARQGPAQGMTQARIAARPWFQPHWVGDLALSLRLQADGPAGTVRIELVEAGAVNRCEIDLATGRATLSRDDDVLGRAATGVRPGAEHELTFANIDDRLTLWVDGRLPFGDGLNYETGVDEQFAPTADDLEPARVWIQGTDATIRGLVLKRDVYYTQDPGEADSDDLSEYRLKPQQALYDLLSDPSRYGKLRWRKPRDYPIEAGHYMMLGDNSSWSRDGRAWTRVDQTTPNAPDRGWDDSGRESWEVPRSLVIGRAFSVYWPHFRPMWPRIRVGTDLVLPARPNFEEVRWIY